MEKHLLIAAQLILFLTSSLFSAESSWHVDLNDYPLYVKYGFEKSDTVAFPDEDSGKWAVLPAGGRGGRIARPIDLDIPEIHDPEFMSFRTLDLQELTYAIPFSLKIPSGIDVPGIHLAALGDNWEIYLNGKLIRSAMDLGSDGRIAIHHSRRDIFFPVERTLFNNGKNLLVIHFVFDPSFESNGFHQAYPYYFDTFENISDANSSLLTFALLILYLFMGIYHIFLYFSEKNYRYNLFYGLFSSDLFLYLFMRTRVVYNLIADTQIVFKIELISLFGILPAVAAFLQLVQNNKVNRLTKIYSVFCAILAVSVIFTPANINLDILRIWQIISLVMILYIFLYLILWQFISAVRRRWKRLENLKKKQSRFSVFMQTIYKTAIGNLLIGSFILVGTAVFDILDSLFFQTDLILTNYGFLVFTLGSAFILANRFAFMNKQTARLNLSLEKKILEVEQASEQSKIAEKKYRSLFQGHSDAVLLLGEDLSVLDGNKAGIKLLGTTKNKLRDINLLQYLAADEKNSTHARNLFKVKFRELMKTGKPTELKMRFSGKMGEKQAVQVRLELIKSLSAGNQILFRGNILQEDTLVNYFVGEKVQYRISNSFPLTEDISRRITANLSRYMDKGDAEVLYIGLREIIINAVEHGNLHISFDDKTRAQSEGRYIEFLMERQKMKEYRDKKVKIEATITREKVLYRIADEGPGFDHKAFLNAALNSKNETLAHGRGIVMTLQLFDSVTYNEKGNEVTLIKELQK
ncbi:ATP-binding protein [Spirochaeta isovalerica]|uniref:PAS domain S-box-containing protein n=1 Tax=Spirochaeta isovalerica TaxID=150 RepID=A0A841R8Y7_9SPIO|nr:ATP-binding protein [Spirochaeta isovalerica]MBB6479419.1 PAS domain S-box-containing protein [Spirochaeta isovalerica]